MSVQAAPSGQLGGSSSCHSEAIWAAKPANFASKPSGMARAIPPGLEATLAGFAARAMPEGLEATLAGFAARAMPEGLDATLAGFAARAIPPGLEATLAGFAARAMPEGLDATLAGFAAQIASEWQLLDPPNWPEGAAWTDMCDLITDTGWSLIHVPRPQVITALLKAAPADRDDVLLSYAAEVVVG